MSDVGMRRANNQDSAVVQISDSSDRWQRRGHLFVVADGMGAHAAGELASKLAVEQIPHHYFRPSDAPVAEALRKAIQEANQEIYQRGQKNPEFHNMGTTGSSLVLAPEGAWVGHVGDSRVYRLRNQSLEQLTFDHSLVWEMEAAGPIDKKLSRNIPKNVITRSLGPNAQVMVDVEGPWPLQSGDTFLLCSDGLTGQVDDVEIGVLLDCLPPKDACRVMVDLANLRGGPDNITIVVVRVDDADVGGAASVAGQHLPRNPPQVSMPFAMVAGTCLLAAIVFLLLGSHVAAAVAGAVSLVAAGVAIIVGGKSTPLASTTSNTPRSTTSPYRRYDCSDSRALIKNLIGTVNALRDASNEKKWTVDWSEINALEFKAKQAQQSGKSREAVHFQSEAIIATMEQLREQHRRQASDSTIDF
ncbi:PP2C family protein-serine/threonine phosphatase [Rosistilla oblonga]|uniref:PP2C family protein-serine/threonine phosphatase n=1 Tax=Rosistilla oblonga TaxID=2527990 RepID=UPI001E647E93|nr:PP2C family serine/threonine-protein phosphatase [Rosistilla oblonga]